MVATRPQGPRYNGLGLGAGEANQMLLEFESTFPVLYPTDRGLYDEWRRLVVQRQVVGKKAHDLRIAAAVRVIADEAAILTFNVRDFQGDEVMVLDPREFAADSN